MIFSQFPVILALSALLLVDSSSSDSFEPAFPLLVLSTSYTSNEISIQSESDGTKYGPMLMRELINTVSGKSSLIVTRDYVQTVTYTDSFNNASYIYKAAECKLVNVDEVNEIPGLWKSRMIVGTGRETRHLYFFGIAALWLNAEMSIKSYTRLSTQEATMRGWYDPVHRWTITDLENRCHVHLYFVDFGSKHRDDMLQLNLVEIEDLESHKILQTFTILKIDSYIATELVDKYLDVPVGFGCHSENLDYIRQPIKFEEISLAFRKNYQLSSFRFELEATATSFPASTDVESPKSSTVFIDYAEHRVDGKKALLSYCRQRSSDMDTKIIYHDQFKVSYEIEMSTGNCSMTSYHGYTEKDSFDISFSNGLTYENFKSVIDMVLDPREQYYYIKRTMNERYVYETTKINGPSEEMRIVQVFNDPYIHGLNLIKLEEIIFIKINQNKKLITETYRFNLMKTEILKGASQIAEVFDISEECYLNNDQMHYNRDFVWFEVGYPLPEAMIQSLIPRRFALRDHIYDQFLEKEHLGVFRVPRMELIFGTNEIVLRALLIDVPKLLIRNIKPYTRIELKNEAKEQLSQLASNLEHCEDLCRLNLCQIMSYCENTHECSLSMSSYSYDNTDYRFEKDNSCDVYKPSLASEDSLQLNLVSLHRVLALLQHDKYGFAVVPAPPADVTADKSNDEAAKLYKYLTELEHFFEHNVDSIPIMTFLVDLGKDFFIMLPTKFSIEDDPLEELHLISKQEDDNLEDQNKAPTFHRGLLMNKYMKKVLQVRDKTDNQLINGLSYDQCSLACVDLRCSSFSYCQKSRECMITDIYNLTEAQEFIQRDTDCFIAQRDFLSKFTKFPDLMQPSDQYQQVTRASNAAECAHHCMTLENFKCLSFEFCTNNRPDSRCLFFNNRLVLGQQVDSRSPSVPSSYNQSNEDSLANCEHYSRSYLADFVRLEHRQIKQLQMERLKTSITGGLSVDRCAELCLMETSDCSAFQFCINLDANSKSSNAPLQVCQTIDSKPTVETPEELLEFSNNCHIFSLTSNNAEVQVQELALSKLLPSPNDPSQQSVSAPTTTLSRALFLYLIVGLVAGGIGFGLVVGYHRSRTFNRLAQSLILLVRPSWIQ